MLVACNNSAEPNRRFVERAEDVLAFGNPVTGKSHLAAAIGHELVRRAYQVRFWKRQAKVTHPITES